MKLKTAEKFDFRFLAWRNYSHFAGSLLAWHSTCQFFVVALNTGSISGFSAKFFVIKMAPKKANAFIEIHVYWLQRITTSLMCNRISYQTIKIRCLSGSVWFWNASLNSKTCSFHVRLIVIPLNPAIFQFESMFI